MAQIRKATATWNGDLPTGSGTVTAATTGIFKSLPINWNARTENPGALTSPEELLATAHAACFSMAFCNVMAKAGITGQSVETTVTMTADKTDAGWRVLKSDIEVTGRGTGLDAAKFQELADQAKDGCPISVAIKGNVQLSVKATLA